MFSFRPAQPSDLEMILRWRTSTFVTRFMLTDIDYDMDAQRGWFEKVARDPSCIYWIVLWQNREVGVINLCDIDVSKHEAGWAFYLGEAEVANLGGLLPPYLYNFVFRQTKILRLNAEVLADNHLVLKLHKLHGYTLLGEREVLKNEKLTKVICMQLTQDVWLTKKKFHRYRADFPGVEKVKL